ncbi:LysE family translocator [Roseitranquillus sediminis]|uniref:LysE family translocator n=1 Tax=Roseitranquillus sediminis TaxID=2809051 RepID=UPI001D0C101B|nr:LysE family transporter [Roseitranquillus sediminis]MBM9593696.1 LysE family transporter [Roseitranquillus sediminis]
MSVEAWLVFGAFWVVFVTSPGPNAVNCVQVAMEVGFRRALVCVLAILMQATLFLTLSAIGVTALIAASPGLYFWIKLAGAAVLIWLGMRGWLMASRPMAVPVERRHLFGRAFLIATINAKSVAGYLAAFSQFVQPGVPIAEQMVVIFPTALTITAASYTGYVALGAGLGRLALGALANIWLRRGMAALFIGYGVALGALQPRA